MLRIKKGSILYIFTWAAETWYLTTKQIVNVKLYAHRIFSLYLRVRRRRQTVRSQPFPPWTQPPPLYKVVHL